MNLVIPNSMVTPSYAMGYARSQSESANPGLWDGAIVLSAPLLGITGTSIPESSGYSGDCHFSGSPTWKLDKYGHSVECTSATLDILSGDFPGVGYPFTIVSFMKTSTGWTPFGSLAKSSSASDYSGLLAQVSTTFEYWPRFAGGSAGKINYTAELPTENTWYSLVGISASSTDHRLYINGTLKATSSGNAGAVPAFDKYSAIGYARPTPSYGNGSFGTFHAYNRVLPPALIQQLAHDPLAAFRRKDQTIYIPSATAGFNRRYYDAFIARSA